MDVSFENNVLNVYNAISKTFDKTRHYVWNEVKVFLDSLPSGSRLLEVGCGNGKNLMYRPDLVSEGCDISLEFVKICRSKNLSVILGNILDLPYQDNSFDNTICVAVIHHLLSLDDRIKAIQELVRVTKGKVYIEVWNEPENNPTKWKYIGDNSYLVKWNYEHDRYYHIFTKIELFNILSQINGIAIIEENIVGHNRVIIICKVHQVVVKK